MSILVIYLSERFFSICGTPKENYSSEIIKEYNLSYDSKSFVILFYFSLMNMNRLDKKLGGEQIYVKEQIF